MEGRPLRIALVSYYLPSGSKIGVGYQVDALARALVRDGHQVDVFSDCPPVDGAPYGHRHIRMTGAMRTFRFAWRLRRVDFSSYDVLHAHTDDYWLWRRRTPVHIRTMHGSCFEEARRIAGLREKTRMVALGLSEVLATFVADRTVVVSPQTRRWMPWVRDVIPNGIDTDQFRPDETRRSAAPVILFVGTWSARKRGAALAAQFRDVVRPQVPGAQLWMVSQDVPDDPGEGIRVLGRVSDVDLQDLYRQAWVFCLPSSYEGFGIPYAEAMASGLPVVATPNVGARYVTRDGQDGLLADLPDLGNVLCRVLQDDRLRARLGRDGLRRSSEFSVRRVIDRYEQLYDEVAQARGVTGRVPTP